jgi:hypothetical protein
MLEILQKAYQNEKKHSPQSIHALLDYYQHKYITDEITIADYKDIFSCLHREGAISAYESTEKTKSTL